MGIDFKDYERLAQKLAWRLTRRAYSRGRNLRFDDFYSEVCMLWVLCRDGYREDGGASFSTYFTRAVFNGERAMYRNLTDPTSLRSIQIGHGYDNGEDEGEDFDIEDANAANPEQQAMLAEQVNKVAFKIPTIVGLLKIIQQEPDELMLELKAAAAHVEFARARGLVPLAAPVALTPIVLMHAFGLDWRQKSRVRNELRRVDNYVR